MLGEQKVAVIPLLAGDLLWFGAPAQGDQSQIVQTVIHCDRVDVDNLEAGSDASSVLLPGETLTFPFDNQSASVTHNMNNG